MTKGKIQAKPENPRLMANLKKHGGHYFVPLIIAAIFAILGSAATLAGPDQLTEITDTITKGIMTGIDLDHVKDIGILLVILYVVGSVLSYGQGFIMATIVQRFSKSLREKISEKINKLPLNYFDSHSQGDVLSRVTNDLDTVSQSLNQSLGSILGSISLFIGCLIMMTKTNVIMSATAVISVLLGFALMMVMMMKSQVHFKAQQQKLAAVSGFAEEMYSGQAIVSSYSATAKAKKDFNALNDDLASSVWKAQFLSGMMQPLMGFIGNFGYVAVCVAGSILTINGDISIGVIVAFMVYVRMFSNPISQIAQAVASLQQASAALGRVFEFLNEEEMAEETPATTSRGPVQGHVTFDHVNFGYFPDKMIIKDFSAEAQPGQKIAIVGPTGAGKTTIVNLLMKFYEIQEGTISIDGTDIKQMTREEVHDEFCMVLQDTWLFEGTIKENLIYNQQHISDEAVIEACKAVGVDYFIRTLPKGYDTLLDDTVNLSVGQKQLLTIARALIKDSAMLILDEATSSVDTRTEELIQKAMDKLMANRTSFVIAHRLSTIRDADLILVMNEGNVIESGNHEALMAQKGFYADLFNSQFEK
jgi:ATP-binding cassette subfamily B protein